MKKAIFSLLWSENRKISKRPDRFFKGYPSNVGSFTIPRTRDGKVISTFTTLEE
jgi:hypothetical protein